MDYIFTLKYQLGEGENDTVLVVERLGEAGCDDALVGIGLPGRIALEFTREAVSAEVALHSALADVYRALPHARLIEVAPDLVGLSDIAEIAGVSRQNIRKLMLGHPGSFPLPVHEGSTSLWHLTDILDWLQGRDYTLAQSVRDMALAAMQVNVLREQRRLPQPLTPELRALAN